MYGNQRAALTNPTPPAPSFSVKTIKTWMARVRANFAYNRSAMTIAGTPDALTLVLIASIFGIVAVLPILVLYALFSRQLIRGITAGAVK